MYTYIISIYVCVLVNKTSKLLKITYFLLIKNRFFSHTIDPDYGFPKLYSS